VFFLNSCGIFPKIYAHIIVINLLVEGRGEGAVKLIVLKSEFYIFSKIFFEKVLWQIKKV